MLYYIIYIIMLYIMLYYHVPYLSKDTMLAALKYTVCECYSKALALNAIIMN